MKRACILLLFLSFLPILAFADYCIDCPRFSVSDLISIHRADDSEYFDVEAYTIINTPPNSDYSTSVSRRDMNSTHMFDVNVKGKGRGNINIVVTLNRSFTHKCDIVIHDSSETTRPELYVDTGRCDPKFQVEPIRGGHGYYFIRVAYYDND